MPHPWGFAAVCASLPFALSFGWLLFVRRFDRARPEPMPVVMATFAAGGLSVAPAAAAEAACAAASPWLDPSVAALGGGPWALARSTLVFALVVGAVEEGAKLLAVWSVARRRPEFDEPVDGIVYACAAALGFAAAENAKYFALGTLSASVIAVRAFATVPAHMFFSAIWGYALGRALVSRRAAVPRAFAVAALAHGGFDATLSVRGAWPVAALLATALALAFVALLRRALRYGAAGAPGPVQGPARAGSDLGPPSERARSYFRVGSPLAFYSCAGGMVACACALTALGAAYEGAHHRVGAPFVCLAATMLAAFGALAYGLSQTVPLDVAVDASGVTFAGAHAPWGAIARFHVELRGRRAFVVLTAAGGAVRLGPASRATAEAIAGAIRAAAAPTSS